MNENSCLPPTLVDWDPAEPQDTQGRTKIHNMDTSLVLGCFLLELLPEESFKGWEKLDVEVKWLQCGFYCLSVYFVIKVSIMFDNKYGGGGQWLQ